MKVVKKDEVEARERASAEKAEQSPKISLGDLVIATRREWCDAAAVMRKEQYSKEDVLKLLGG